MGIAACALLAAVVLTANTALTVRASMRYGIQGGAGTNQHGKRQRDQERKSVAPSGHQCPINTRLLSASNYAIQSLSSPTRKEVDKSSHARYTWLDIGIISVRDLRSKILP